MLEQCRRTIGDFYGDRCAVRSGVPWIYHIDEGLAVLRAIGSSELAMAAFCLHPIVQSDDNFVRAVSEGLLEGHPSGVLLLAMVAIVTGKPSSI